MYIKKAEYIRLLEQISSLHRELLYTTEECERALSMCNEASMNYISELIDERDELRAENQTFKALSEGKRVILNWWLDGNTAHVVTTDGEAIYEYRQRMGDDSEDYEAKIAHLEDTIKYLESLLFADNSDTKLHKSE